MDGSMDGLIVDTLMRFDLCDAGVAAVWFECVVSSEGCDTCVL